MTQVEPISCVFSVEKYTKYYSCWSQVHMPINLFYYFSQTLMQIYLMQHGQALSEEIDPQRHLSPEGRAQIEKTSNALKRMGVSFDLLTFPQKK